mgnify:CR=1 FL=1
MNYIRKANIHDSSRLAEILIFAKRMNYRKIFHNDKVSFEEMQVYPLAQYYINHPESLENIWVYDDEFVKGMIHIEGRKIIELYVDSFFENMGIGTKLIEFAIQTFNVKNLFVLEKKYRCNPLLSASWICINKGTTVGRRNDRIYCKHGTLNF